MPLDEETRRFALLMQGDLLRMAAREREHRAHGAELRYDPVSRVAIWEARGGDVLGRSYGERLATFHVRDRILRWAWAFRSPVEGATHAESVFRQGQARGVAQLSMSVVNDVDLEQATSLARLGAVAAGAEGFLVDRRDDDTVDLLGLFERARPAGGPEAGRVATGARLSVPPPPVAEVAEAAAPPSPYRSLPGSKAAGHVSAAAESPHDLLRSKSRFLPLAGEAVAALGRRCPAFSQGLLVVSVAPAPEDPENKRRLFVQLVAIDAQGLLVALDPPADLVEASARMIGDARSRKVTARIAPKPDGGATLHVDVI